MAFLKKILNMLELILIYFIGKQYYTLAEDRNMHK